MRFGGFYFFFYKPIDIKKKPGIISSSIEFRTSSAKAFDFKTSETARLRPGDSRRSFYLLPFHDLISLKAVPNWSSTIYAVGSRL